MKRENRKSAKSENAEIKKLLSGLYPGESIDERYQSYRIRKRIVVTAVMLIGVVGFICLQVGSRMQDRLKDGIRLERNEWGEGSYFIALQANTTSKEGKIDYQIKERVFTDEEIEILLSQAKSKLQKIILSENQNLMQIKNDLNLVSELEEYPFSIAWKSSNYEKIRTDGKVNLEGVKADGEEILLTAIFTYEGNVWEEVIQVMLVPAELSEEEVFLGQIKELLAEKDASSAKEAEMELPKMLQEEEIIWKEKKTGSSFWLLLAGIVGAILCAWGMDKDLWKKNQIRQEEIKRSYPEFISRLTLYMGAGLTIRNAFLRIGRDYRQEKRRTKKKVYLYEEVLISGYQLINGKGEEEVYREWGRRCDITCCRKLGFLLTASLRQGNEKIITMLEKEVHMAWEERKNRAKKQGEEAGTKMLFPMMMMLLMVMFLILLPAFTGLQ